MCRKGLLLLQRIHISNKLRKQEAKNSSDSLCVLFVWSWFVQAFKLIQLNKIKICRKIEMEILSLSRLKKYTALVMHPNSASLPTQNPIHNSSKAKQVLYAIESRGSPHAFCQFSSAIFESPSWEIKSKELCYILSNPATPKVPSKTLPTLEKP